MKKVLFILCAVAMMSFSCPDYSRPISSSCWSGCVTTMTIFGMRAPSDTEFKAAQEELNTFCANKPVVYIGAPKPA
jgi:hypothetical protein